MCCNSTLAMWRDAATSASTDKQLCIKVGSTRMWVYKCADKRLTWCWRLRLLCVQVLRYQVDFVQQQATVLDGGEPGALQQQQQQPRRLSHQQLPVLQPLVQLQQQQQPAGLIDSSYPHMPPLAQHRQGHGSFTHSSSSDGSKSEFAAAALQRRTVSQSQIMLNGNGGTGSSSAAALATAASAAGTAMAAEGGLVSRRSSAHISPRGSVPHASWAVSAPNSSRDLRPAVAGGLATSSSTSTNMPGQLPPIRPGAESASAFAVIEKLLRSDSGTASSSSAQPSLAQLSSKVGSSCRGSQAHAGAGVEAGNSSSMHRISSTDCAAAVAGSIGHNSVVLTAPASAAHSARSSNRHSHLESACSADQLPSIVLHGTAALAALSMGTGCNGALDQQQPILMHRSSSHGPSRRSLFNFEDTARVDGVAAAGRVGDYSCSAASVQALGYDGSSDGFGCGSEGSSNGSSYSSGDGSASSRLHADSVKARQEARKAEDLMRRAAELEQARR